MGSEQSQPKESNPVAPSPTAAQATPATKSRTPALPPELVADIIDLTVEIMDGLVTPAKVELFITEVKKHQPELTLESVRFGVGSAGLDAARDSSGDDVQFDALVGALPGLRKLEINGDSLVFVRGLPRGLLTCDQLRLSNPGIAARYIPIKFYENWPTTLVIDESTPEGALLGRMTGNERKNDAFDFIRFTIRVQNIFVTSNQESGLAHVTDVLMLGTDVIHIRLPTGEPLYPGPFLLNSFHFECTSPSYITTKILPSNLKLSFGDKLEYRTLSHLATHLGLLHFIATAGDRPSLSSLNIVPYPEGTDPDSTSTLEEAERMLLELVDLPVLAKLKVPECWRSDAVEGACEAKGINIRWT
ncbi:hypothetical protein RQP46_003135 [Phenoliferia psychrophenolica]